MKSTQSDRGLQFDGIGEGPAKGSRKYQHNHWSGHSNDGREVNYPGQQRNGAVSKDPAAKNVGASVTKDPARRAPDRVGSGARPANPDRINVGSQQRNPGGTRAWAPKAGQNYNGNPDSIRVGQNGGNSYGEISRGRTPVSKPSNSDGMNYGPKSQY